MAFFIIETSGQWQLHSGFSLIRENEMRLEVLLGYGEESSTAFADVVTHHHGLFAPPATDSYRRIELKRTKGCKIQPVIFMSNPESHLKKGLPRNANFLTPLLFDFVND